MGHGPGDDFVVISPDDIRGKAERLYPRFLRAWLAGEEFFPRVVPGEKTLPDDLADAAQQVQALRQASKEGRGYGYTIEWDERASRTHGRNRFPSRIVFETREDFLPFVGRSAEFESFRRDVELVRTRLPRVEPWIPSNRRRFIDLAGDVEGLVSVVEYLRENPRPDVFARELPLEVDTKFIERHRRVLREWFDLALPPDSIRADETHFWRRYGFRYAEPLVHLRFLDDALRAATSVPWAECALPLHSLASLDVSPGRVLIVENKVNLLTLPRIPRTLALGGMGEGVSDLRVVRWLSSVPIDYWGDVDCEGLAILSRLRTTFPQTRSVLMDDLTLETWVDVIGGTGTGRRVAEPANLTDGERSAFDKCAAENLRIEQERFPHQHVVDVFASGEGNALDRET